MRAALEAGKRAVVHEQSRTGPTFMFSRTNGASQSALGASAGSLPPPDAPKWPPEKLPKDAFQQQYREPPVGLSGIRVFVA